MAGAASVVTDRKWLSVALVGIAFHSMLTGVLLLLHPEELLVWAGWHALSEPFFAVQGGVFHLLLGVLYLYTARVREGQQFLLQCIVIIKSAAAVFLLTYYVFVDAVWLILLSGIGDGAMAVTVHFLSRSASVEGNGKHADDPQHGTQ
ncbi:hypothetical protein KQI65_03920 [bacterium]|nr:hypothetical protein [bacterium]